ncbi:MAG: peptidase domain-containing ABC transporter [Reyranella sp.]|uniref:peptidase domain-containing ABC transporter n=1 Tax=Reyranella sp. TaxID=1929291 RepID=UPI001AC834FF|nr:peptidase domain-containing ABC transporter [Reyranella sp.]MBN9091481.1 peptidase domain-containing ABC transporter [Reyranella sp.]
MAPSESAVLVLDPPRSRGVDSLMRALLYIVRQLGRPVSEAELRDAAALPAGPLDPATFLLAARRLGFVCQAVDPARTPLPAMAMPFVLIGGRQPARVVVSIKAGRAVVLDVVEGHVVEAELVNLLEPGCQALVLRMPPPSMPEPEAWYAPIWAAIRPALAQLAMVSFAVNLLALASPLFMMLVVNRLAGHAPAEAMGLIALLAAGLFAVYAIDFGLRLIRGWLSARAAARLDLQMSTQVVHHLVRLPYGHFERNTVGVIAERLRQLDVLRGFCAGQLPALAIDLVFAALFLAALFAIDGWLGLVALAAIPLLLAVPLASHRTQRRLADELFQALAAKGSALTETVANAATVKALGLEAEVERRWRARVERAAHSSFRASQLGNVTASASASLQLLALLAVVLLGVHEIARGHLTIGGLVAANLLAARALLPMRQIASAWQQLQGARSAFARLDELMTEPAESPSGALAPIPLGAGRIALERVCWRPQDDAADVLRGADLAIAGGEIIGLVGPSGSGKTTLANMIQGLHRPTAGRVLVDGMDVAHLAPAQLRAEIGCVPQEVQLFAGSVLDNIAMGVADKDPAIVAAAACFVGAHDFIERLPQGYDTVLGERGQGLSMGQRQLLCIARALIRNPRILILDEATSALDPATEEQLLRRLRGSLQGRTVIMITHRLAPLAIADRVALVMDGRIETTGTPTEVMAYARLRMAEASRRHAPV